MEPFSSKTVGGLAREMGITVSVRVCLIMNHGTILEQNRRGSAHEFHRFCSRLFDYEPWNHIPQVIEGSQIVWWGSLRLAPIN